MRIGIDVSPVVYGTGVSTYTKNLVSNLLSIDKKNCYILFGGTLRRNRDLKRFYNSLKGNFEGVSYLMPPTLTDLLWNKLHILRIEKLMGKIDIFHSSDWAQPPSKAFKITTVHDLVPIKYPKLSHPRIVSVHTKRLKWVKKEVDRIIAPSKTTEKDLTKLGIKKDRIRVIPEAAGSIFKPAAESEIKKQKKKYHIKGKYLLAVGVNPRKNTQRIIQAFEKLKNKNKLTLIVIGHPFMKMKPTKGVIMLGYDTALNMPALYSGAEALVYPSIYEGFGLPILEAFACRTCVVTSDLGSMREIAENAAILVNPYNVGSISAGIEEALENKEKLVMKGVKRVKKFSWTRTAKLTLKVYQELQELL